MKKIFLLFIIIFTFGYPINLFAEGNEILIKTIDNKIFKEILPDDYNMLVRHGFGTDSSIGTPFSVEFQSTDPYPLYLFYFPIIRNGEIVSYVEQRIMEGEFAGWAVSEWFSDESDLTQLSNGNAYAIIHDKNINELAVSDNDVIILRSDPGYLIDYNTPYEGKETKIVNIMEPIDIDKSFLTPEVDDERAIFENARKKGRRAISQRNADELGVINKNDRLLIPLRNIAELIGCTVEWDSAERAAYAKKGDNTVKFVIGKIQYSVNDKVYNLDVPAEIYNGKTFIPLRAVSEAFDADIAYNSATKMITLSY